MVAEVLIFVKARSADKNENCQQKTDTTKGGEPATAEWVVSLPVDSGLQREKMNYKFECAAERTAKKFLLPSSGENWVPVARNFTVVYIKRRYVDPLGR